MYGWLDDGLMTETSNKYGIYNILVFGCTNKLIVVFQRMDMNGERHAPTPLPPERSLGTLCDRAPGPYRTGVEERTCLIPTGGLNPGPSIL